MKAIAIIRANDEKDGDKIEVGYIRYTDDDGNRGFQTATSDNGEVGYHRAQSAKKCIADISAMWGDWDTYETI